MAGGRGGRVGVRLGRLLRPQQPPHDQDRRPPQPDLHVRRQESPGGGRLLLNRSSYRLVVVNIFCQSTENNSVYNSVYNTQYDEKFSTFFT